MLRRLLFLLLPLLTLTGSLATYWVTAAEASLQLRGYVDATQDADLPYRIPLLGVNADLRPYSGDERRWHLAQMQRAGFTWVRQFVYWDDIQPEATKFDWSLYDSIIEAIDQFDELQLVLVLMNSPSWARVPNSTSSAPPVDLAAWQSFVGQVAARYGRSVDIYQIWDEPNLEAAWGGQNPQATDYAALLQIAYQAIKSEDGAAQILSAALAPTTELGPRNISDIRYLEDLYQLGLAEFSDAVAAKPYGFSVAANDRTVDEDTLNFARIIALREVMIQNDDALTPLWASNVGWNHLPTSWQGTSSIWGAVSQAEQIDYTLQAIARAEREWPWLGGLVLYHWQPHAPSDSPLWGYSLLDTQSRPTPLLEALYARPPQSSALDGLHHPRTPYAEYSGIWSFSDFGADIGWLETSDSQLALEFTGSDIALLLREGDYFAFLYPQIDGQPANATPQDANGNSYLLLRSETLRPTLGLHTVARHLPIATHRLQVSADKGWDQWALAGYAISRGNLAQPYHQQMQVALLSALIAFAALLVNARHSPIFGLWQQFRYPLTATSHLFVTTVSSLALMVGMLLTWSEASPHVLRRDAYQWRALVLLSGGLLAFEWPFLLVVLMTLLIFYLVYQRPVSGLYLVVLFAPFFLFPVELYRFAFPLAELLLLITFVAWSLRKLADWGRYSQTVPHVWQRPFWKHFHWTATDTLALSLFALGSLALFWSSRLAPALTEWRTLFLEPLLFYILARDLLHSPRERQQISDMLIASGFLVALIGLWMYLNGQGVITTLEGASRLASVYGSPNNVGLLFDRVIPLVLFGILVSSGIRRKVLLVIATVLALALLLTQSVGALLIGLPVAIALIVVMRLGRRAVLPLVGLSLVALLLIGLFTQVSPRFANLLDPTEGTNFIRLRVWEASLNMLADHPLTGLGLDQFFYAYRAHYVLPDAIGDPDLSHPHNVILDVWLRLGFLGIVWFIAALAVLWRTIRQSLPTELWVIPITAALGSALAHGFIDNSIFVVDLMLIFMLHLALLANIKGKIPLK